MVPSPRLHSRAWCPTSLAVHLLAWYQVKGDSPIGMEPLGTPIATLMVRQRFTDVVSMCETSYIYRYDYVRSAIRLVKTPMPRSR